MNVFVETSSVFTDPFWKRTYAKELLDAAKSKKITIYISEVVCSEIKYNYKKKLVEEFNKIEKALLELDKITEKTKKRKEIKIEDYISDLEIFYKNLFFHKNIIEVKAESFLFKEILKRAINHEKPFFNNSKKPQFKDSVIWVSYFKHSIKNNLREIHLITDNTNDFVKEELQKDFGKLECYNGIGDFVKIHKDIISKPSTNFLKWISKSSINEKFIFNLFVNNDDVISDLKNIVINEMELFSKIYRESNSVEMDYNSIRPHRLERLEIDSFNNYAFVSCEFSMIQNGKIYQENIENIMQYNYYRTYNIPITFIIDKEKKMKEVQIESHVTKSSGRRVLK